MGDAIKELLERARHIEMSPSQREVQRRSFAYGNTHFENQDISREMIDREAERLAAKQPAPDKHDEKR